jgi:SRSO17 transposase
MTRAEPRLRLRRFVLGMMAGLPRTNCWSLAEHAGEASPRGMQRLLSSASWDADAMLGDVRDWVVLHLGAPGAILVIDETGDVKKGTATVGVQRQYTGTAGRIENAQVAVYLTYASTKGHALMDRALYLPRSWTDDSDRLAAAGVPGNVEFATKPALAQAMISGALAAGVPASWVAGDEVYGAAQAPARDRHRICPGRREEPSGRHRDRCTPGHRPGRPAAGVLLAAHVCRPGLQGRAVV